jgi:hypothetical protein
MKTVVPIKNPAMPTELQKQWAKDYEQQYWPSINRNFFLVDGEIYYEDFDPEEQEEQLLFHWSTMLYRPTKCLTWPLVRKNGEHLFEVVHTDAYETSVRASSDGKYFVVHTG